MKFSNDVLTEVFETINDNFSILRNEIEDLQTTMQKFQQRIEKCEKSLKNNSRYNESTRATDIFNTTLLTKNPNFIDDLSYNIDFT